MYRACILNSIAPQLRAEHEHLVAARRHWISNGVSGQPAKDRSCRTTDDCMHSEICQEGYCAGPHFVYNAVGIYSDPDDYYPNPQDNYAGKINRPLHHILIQKHKDYEADYDHA